MYHSPLTHTIPSVVDLDTFFVSLGCTAYPPKYAEPVGSISLPLSPFVDGRLVCLRYSQAFAPRLHSDVDTGRRDLNLEDLRAGTWL